MRGNPFLLAVLTLVLGTGCSEATGGSSGTSTGSTSGSSSASTGTSGGSSTGSTGGSSTGGGSTTGSSGGSSTGGASTSGGTSGCGKAAGAPCSSDAECTSTVCGLNGSGACCVARCDTSDATCGATACDGQGLCVYPTSQLQCRAPSCASTTLTQAASCNGAGNCPAVATIDCSPYSCNGSSAACTTSCSPATSSTDCAAGDFCDRGFQHCCSGLSSGGAIKVDATTGSDATECCGIGANQACQTLTRAMVLIDAAQAQNVTIVATVNGGGGDWTTTETYPVVLGWGVELSAPGVFFIEQYEATAEPPEVLYVRTYSATDTVGTASIAGSAQSPVNVGMDSANNQTGAEATIRVEKGATLSIANASVNSSAESSSAYYAFDVSPGATLVLGQDQSGGVTGTVTIGNALGVEATDGKWGIYCETDFATSTGCTIKDAALKGQSSVVIQGQRGGDLVAVDFSTISLSSNPVIGVPPTRAGFDKCPQKNDGIGENQAVFLQGPVTMTFNNGAVQCIPGAGFYLAPSAEGSIGGPKLSLDNTIIQNTEVGILGKSGTVIATNTTINYNVIGVEQAQGFDGNNGSIDLSGGGNTIICSSNKESSQSYKFPGIDVYNASTAELNASNVAWDTTDPDYFDCDQDFSCTCNNGFSCTTAAGSDDMDAVEDSSSQGGITTTGASQARRGCN